MQRQKARPSFNPARALPLAALVFAVVAACFPSTTPARQQQQQQQPSSGRPRTVTPPSPSGASAVKPTPTPSPSPQPASPRLQTTPGYKQGDPAVQPTPSGEGQTVDEDEVVTVDTSEIKLNVRVVDRLNRPVNDVRQEEFRVFEDGVLQTVESFTKAEVPISYGIVIDNSGSLRNQINQVIDASKTIVNSNKPGDETFLVRFVSSDEIKVMQDWTANKQDLNDALDDLFVEGGQTAILDAVYLSAEHAATHKKGNDLEDKRRRALILVTDGEDRNSFYKTEQLFEALKEEDVQI
ncbi:MAG TPA: VWA domain-containing protein, partial [Pyrinomonadaceae bacterium]